MERTGKLYMTKQEKIDKAVEEAKKAQIRDCLLYTSLAHKFHADRRCDLRGTSGEHLQHLDAHRLCQGGVCPGV